MEAHILIPRKVNLGKVSKVDVILTQLLVNKVETNQASGVIYHMIELRRDGNVQLLYSHLIIKNYVFDLEDKQSMEISIKIGSHCLGQIQYDHHNEVLVHKGIKARGGSQHQQDLDQHQAPQQELISYFEDLNYETPQTFSNEALLNIVLKNQQAYTRSINQTNAKLDYMSQKLVETRTPLSFGFFNDNDEDNEYPLSTLLICLLFSLPSCFVYPLTATLYL